LLSLLEGRGSLRRVVRDRARREHRHGGRWEMRPLLRGWWRRWRRGTRSATKSDSRPRAFCPCTKTESLGGLFEKRPGTHGGNRAVEEVVGVERGSTPTVLSATELIAVTRIVQGGTLPVDRIHAHRPEPTLRLMAQVTARNVTRD